MRLNYELGEADKAAVDAAVGKDEKYMYSVPFDIEGDKFVSGYLYITDKKIYKVLKGKLIETFALEGAEGLKTDVFYGNCAFYGRFEGKTRMVCRFLSSRNLKRYSILIKILENMIETGDTEIKTDDSREMYCPQCGRPYVGNINSCIYCIDKKAVYKKLFAMTKGMRLMMLFPLFVAAIALLFRFLVPYIESIVINQYVQPPAGVERGSMLGFYLILLAIISIDLVQRIIDVIKSLVSANTTAKFQGALKNILYEKIQSLPVSYTQKKSTGDLMGRVNSDTATMRIFITDVIPTIFIQVCSFVIAFFLLIFMNWKMALFIIIPLPFTAYLLKSFWKKIGRRHYKRWKREHISNIVLHDIFYGIRVVKAFGTEELEIERFEKANKDFVDQVEINDKYTATFGPIVSFVTGIGNYFIMLYGYLLLYDKVLDIGTLYQFLSYSGIVFGPLLYMTDIPKQLSNFITSATKVFEILEEPMAVDTTENLLKTDIEGDIEFRDLTFGYNSYDPVLKNINISIKSGEFIGIVGLSGSGKSTLINLVMRLYEPNKGALYIDGIDARKINHDMLCSNIGVVLQETFLFAGTIRENIAYAKPYATEEEIINAARIAHAHDFIMKLPYGYETYVGERGLSLSGGERQRIAIARAIIKNPRILILDEATAALDTETEKLIQDALNHLTDGRTTLAIAHRLSTLRNADRLLVLDHGRVAEFGSHTELLANKGIYYKLVMAQRKMAHELVEDIE
ncbi:MAG: ABC transporter ATP-binding protein [Ruminococcaceae bacterium]|nr:ABC transporter ATP-binding protein [Oscillospiraceae bacterium]